MEIPRPAPPRSAPEREMLEAWLDFHRLTLERKCHGLAPAQLRRRAVPPSALSLLGLVRHMAEVERTWFRRRLAGEEAPRLYCSEQDRDGDWNGAVADPAVVADAWRAWRAEVAFAERYVADSADLGSPGAGETPLRDVLVHMIEEYARHCGHADLLRERIDGRVGQ